MHKMVWERSLLQSQAPLTFLAWSYRFFKLASVKEKNISALDWPFFFFFLSKNMLTQLFLRLKLIFFLFFYFFPLPLKALLF